MFFVSLDPLMGSSGGVSPTSGSSMVVFAPLYKQQRFVLSVLQMPDPSPTRGFRRVCFLTICLFWGILWQRICHCLRTFGCPDTDSYLMSLMQVFTQSSVFQSIILKACLSADLSKFTALAFPVHFPTAWNAQTVGNGASYQQLEIGNKQAHLIDIIPARSLGLEPICCLCPPPSQCVFLTLPGAMLQLVPCAQQLSGGKHQCSRTQTCSYGKLSLVWSLFLLGLAKTLPGNG